MEVTRKARVTPPTIQQLIDAYLGEFKGSIVDYVATQCRDQERRLEEATRDLEVFKKAHYLAEREIREREASFEKEKRALKDQISQLRQERIYALNHSAGWSTDSIPPPPPTPPPVSSLSSTPPPTSSSIGKTVELQDARLDPGARKNPQSLEVLCSSGIPVWKFLTNFPLTKEERISLITSIFTNCRETEIVMGLSRDDAQSFVDGIDETLEGLTPQLRSRCLGTMCKICGCHGILPKSVQIPLCYDRMGNPLCHGGYADVWKGKHEGCEVAVKVLKVYQTSNLDKIKRRFCREVMAWKSLRHQNVLPLFGVTMRDNQFAMASEWMDNGNINQFVGVHRDADRFVLLKDVVQGLIYMHSEGMAHGDLKGANILINRHGRACIADFGLAAIVSDTAYSTTLTSSANAGTIRWMGPERLDPPQFGVKDSRPTKKSDCYALGMVILEVLSGKVPFAQDSNDFLVTHKVLKGERPERPHAAWSTDYLWGTLQACWSPQPNDRPTAEAVLECLMWASMPPSREDGSQIASESDDKSLAILSHPALYPTEQGYTM